MKNYLNMAIPIKFVIFVILVLLLCEDGFFSNAQNDPCFRKFRAGVVVVAIDFHNVFIAQFLT